MVLTWAFCLSIDEYNVDRNYRIIHALFLIQGDEILRFESLVSSNVKERKLHSIHSD